MADMQNARRSAIVREMATLVLQREGLPARARQGRKLSELLGEGDDYQGGDILDIPGWAIVTRANVTMRLSEAMNTARAIADRDGKKHAAVVQYRQDALASDTFVVLTLGDFARVLAESADVKLTGWEASRSATRFDDGDSSSP